MLLSRSVETEKNQDQNSEQVQEVQQPQQEIHQNVSQNDKIENITQQVDNAVNTVQTSDCVYVECNPILDNLPHEQTNFISVHQPHQTINYNIPHHNQIQIGGYTLQNVSQVPIYNGTYSMPLQPIQCNQGLPQLQVISFCFSQLFPYSHDLSVFTGSSNTNNTAGHSSKSSTSYSDT